MSTSYQLLNSAYKIINSDMCQKESNTMLEQHNAAPAGGKAEQTQILPQTTWPLMMENTGTPQQGDPVGATELRTLVVARHRSI